MATICVLLSSYNGEKFITEQIDSILKQEGVDVKLIVRDDGSTDGTVSILEDYSQKGLLSFYTGANLGWKRSFLDLMLNAPESDFYAFSDQDDYWHPNKLVNAISALTQLPCGSNLYISNTIYWKNEYKKVTRTIPPLTNKEHCLIWCIGPGCTMVFNKELLKLIQDAPPKIEIAHDKRLQQVASLFGSIYYDMNSYIDYRQHGNNQLGATLSIKENFRRRFRYYMSFHNSDILRYEALDLMSCYGHLLSNESLSSCELMASYKSKISAYFKMLFSTKFVHEKLMTTLAFKLMILLRKL